MTFSKQTFPLFCLLFLFPSQHASNPMTCSSTMRKTRRCGGYLSSQVPILFPFCGHPDPRFNLQCYHTKIVTETILKLPMSGAFFVQKIDYYNQQIHIDDPEKCLVKRLLTFNISGSPFSYRPNNFYTFLSCPNEVVLSSWYPSIPCLSNSTSSFFATSNSTLAESMLPSCQIVKKLNISFSQLYKESNFSSYINKQRILLEWDSPNCKACAWQKMRCGFQNETSDLQIKCFKYGLDKNGRVITVLEISAFLILIGVVTLYVIIRIRKSRRISRRRWHVAITAATLTQQRREIIQES